MKLLISSLKQTIQSSPFVLKEINRYFGFYFIGGSLVVLFIFNRYFPGQEAGFSALSSFTPLSLVQMALIFLSRVFTVFMIPYYAYKHKKGAIQPFWIFIQETVWPVVLNHIKAFFIILFFFIFLIIPGIYKAIRYTFLTETVLFDDLYKQGTFSALKSADKTSRGYFWLIVFFFILQFAFSALPNIIKIPSSFPLFVASGLVFIVKFYFSCLMILFKTQFYFELKQRRGESISC